MARPKLPTVMPGGYMLMQMSAAQRREVFGNAFEMCGGTERLVHEANRSADGYWRLVDHYAKGAAKAPVQLTHNLGNSTEDMVDELERSEKAQVIGGTFTEDEPDDAT